MKNIVICCDGTRGKYDAEEKNTNVVRLFERLAPDGSDQVSYYDPGVGTHSSAWTWLGRWLSNLAVSATGTSLLGAGVKGNVRQAYKYLMEHYEPRDRVFLFGYSRGAHTVRVLAAMLYKCGLLTKGSDNLIPYMINIYNDKNDERIADGFKQSFSRMCKPHFIGVWDTVAMVGLIPPFRRRFSNNRLNPDVANAYQALAIDEKRWHFQPSVWEEGNLPVGQTIEQVWFPGCHADVGGQDLEAREISDYPLMWMLGKADDGGLCLKDNWSDGLRPDYKGPIKWSWKWFWLVTFHGPTKRVIPATANIHPSGWQRQTDPDCKYNPTNLPSRGNDAV